jgi:oligosaccharide repeat unit polymerase
VLAYLVILTAEKPQLVLSLMTLMGAGGLVYWLDPKALFVSPVALFFTFYVLLIVVGSFIVALDSRDQRVFLLIASSAGAFAIGAFLAARRKGFKASSELDAFYQKEWQDAWQGPGFYYALAFFAVLTLYGSYKYFELHGIPMAESNVNLAIADAIEGSDYYIHFLDKCLPFLALILIGKALGHQNRLARLPMYAFSGLVCLLLIGTAFRAVLLQFLIMLFLLRQSYKRLTWRSIAAYAGVALLSILFITNVRFAKEDTFYAESVWDSLGERIFMMNAQNIDEIVYLFDRHEPFMLGRGYVMDIASLQPGPDESFSVYVTTRIRGHSRLTLTPTIIGEAYGNFAYPGTLLLMLLTGYIFSSLFIRYLRGTRSVGRMVIYAYSFTFLAKTVTQGFGRNIIIEILPILLSFFLLELAASVSPAHLGQQRARCESPS